MSEVELKELGKVIRAKRELRGLTQVELAEKSGLDRNYIGMVERGERNPSYLSLQKIAQGLGLSVDEMIKPWTSSYIVNDQGAFEGALFYDTYCRYKSINYAT